MHMPTPIFNCLCIIGTVCALAVSYYLFKDLSVGSMVFCVVLLVVMMGLAQLRLRTGAVKKLSLIHIWLAKANQEKGRHLFLLYQS